MSDPCSSCAWLCDTDPSLGGADVEWVISDTPLDLTTPLADYEAIADFSQPYTADFDDVYTQCCVALWIYVLTHMNQQNNQLPGFVPIRIRTIPIYVPPVKVRVIQKVHTQGSGGTGGG